MRIKVEDTTYDFEPGSVTVREAIALKAHTGMALKAWQAGLSEVDGMAFLGLVWLLKTRAGEPVVFDDLDFAIDALDMDEDKAEDKEEAPDPTTADPAAA